MLEPADSWSELGLLADPLRRAIFDRLIDGPRHVNAIVEGLPVTQSAVSQQLRKMKDAGLLEEERRGKFVVYAASRLARERLRKQAYALCQRLDATTDGKSPQRPDVIDAAMETWEHSWPELDPVTMGVFLRVYLISNILKNAFDDAARKFDLNGIELRLLAVLERTGSPYEATLTELSRTTLSSLPSVSRYLSNVERKEFIERRPHRLDGRSNLLRLTEKGRNALHQVINSLRTNELRAVYGMSEARRTMAAQVMRDLLNLLGTVHHSDAVAAWTSSAGDHDREGTGH